MESIVLPLLALLATLSVSLSTEQCVYHVNLELGYSTFMSNCNGMSARFCDSWNNAGDKPSGNCTTFNWGSSCSSKFQAPGPCINICSVQLYGSRSDAQLDITSEATDERVTFLTLEQKYNFREDLCTRKPDPGTKFIKIDSAFMRDGFVQIPEACTFDDKTLKIECGAGCAPSPPPSGGECLYEIKIKTQCAAFAGNPFGTVSVSISDKVSGGWSRQLSGNILSFKKLDHPGIPDCTACSLSTFYKRHTCISFCAMELRLDNTGLKWSVDYVQVSNKYLTKKFNLQTTLKPSHETGEGDYATVLSSLCTTPRPNYMQLPGAMVEIPQSCTFDPWVSAYGYQGSLACDCIQISSG